MGEGKQRLDAMFQDLLPTSSANEKVYDVMTLTKAYHKYKREYVKHLVFTPEGKNLSKYLWISELNHLFSATMLDHAPLEAVNIYFDTASYDEIERDEKVTLPFKYSRILI